jgi:hypothetical protein
MRGLKITEFNIRLEMPQALSNTRQVYFWNWATNKGTECQTAYDDNNKFQITLDFQLMNIIIIST